MMMRKMWKRHRVIVTGDILTLNDDGDDDDNDDLTMMMMIIMMTKL